MADDQANLARLERDDILHRKNVDLLSPDELSAFRRAVQGMKALSEQVRSDRRGFFAHAGRHGVPDWLCPHHTPERLFLPWHRAYLYRFEQALQDQVPGVTLPWWDWTTARGIPEAYGAEETPEGDANPLRRTKTLVTDADRRERRPVVTETERSPGPPGQLPDSDDLVAVRGEANFLLFSDALEEVHDSIHVWVGGDMGDVAYAAFDPVFWAHHCMIDRVWWLWQQQNRLIVTPAANQLDIVLEPFNMTVRDTLNANALGYEYAGNEVLLEPAADGGGGSVTAAVDLAEIARADFQRADLEIGGIRHTGSSYEGRVFFNRPDADRETDTSDPSYVGAFHVFAHGGCYGAEGHCDVPDERRRFDRRPLPLAIRMKKRVNVTEALRGAVQAGGELKVTIVGVPVEGSRRGEEAESVLDVKRLSLVTYL